MQLAVCDECNEFYKRVSEEGLELEEDINALFSLQTRGDSQNVPVTFLNEAMPCARRVWERSLQNFTIINWVSVPQEREWGKEQQLWLEYLIYFGQKAKLLSFQRRREISF